jgi:hypothetical protein
MAKWDDKHMYNWVGWMRSISALYKKVEDWCFIEYSFPRYMAFGLNLTFGSILKYTLIGLMAIPQTIEWIMANIIEGVDYLIVNNNKEEDARQLRVLIGVVMAFTFVLPYAITWGLPNLISEIIKRRKEKKANRRVVMETIRDSVIEDLNPWEVTNRSSDERFRNIMVQLRRDRTKDFTPKKDIKAHKFNTERKVRYVSPGVYTRDEFRIVQHREGNVVRTYVTDRENYINRTNMEDGYFININRDE